MDLGLAGKRAIVTGGTRGIGRKIVDLLAAEGCAVGLCARDKAQTDDAVAALSGRGATVIGGAVDVSDDAGLRGWIGETAESLGGLDILVANACALAGSAGTEAWRSGLEVDILGTVARSKRHCRSWSVRKRDRSSAYPAPPPLTLPAGCGPIAA